jgi:hypothetical protein
MLQRLDDRREAIIEDMGIELFGRVYAYLQALQGSEAGGRGRCLLLCTAV